MKLVGISACVPKGPVDPTLAYEHFEKLEVDRIVDNTGVLSKREGPPGMTGSDLCIAAAGPLLDKLGWDRESVDALIFVTTSPDFFMPATAHRIQKELGVGDRCLVFDVNLGCSGYTHGLIVINSMIQAGLIRRALLLNGDASAGRIRPQTKDANNRASLGNSLLFGDAGTATALSDEGDQVRSVQFGADGANYEHIIVPGGGFRSYWNQELFESSTDDKGEERRPIDLIVRGPEILSFSMKRVPPLVKDLLAQASWERDDVDAFAFHQANRFILNFLARRMKVPPEKMLMSIEEYGNTVGASIPLTMVVKGEEHLTQPTKWVMCGFGVGLSWSGLAIETDEIVTLPMMELGLEDLQ